MSRLFFAGNCCLCGCSNCDKGGGVVVKRSGSADTDAFVLFFCLDCVDYRLEEVKEQTKKIMNVEHLVRL